MRTVPKIWHMTFIHMRHGGDTPMGRTILGTPETLEKINSDSMRAYIKSHYTSDNIIISVSGNLCENFFVLLEQFFGNNRLIKGKPLMEEAHYSPGSILKTKDTEQLQLVVGFNGIDIMDESVYSLLVFNNVFGCGMSSRLFSEYPRKIRTCIFDLRRSQRIHRYGKF